MATSGRWSGRGTVAAITVLTAMWLGFTQAQAREPVYVGAYDFPPYLVVEAGVPTEGVVLELLAYFNAQQDDYHFQLFLTSPARRFNDMAAGHFSIILFENPAWGWGQTPVYAALMPEHLDDREVYVARAETGRGQEYFADLAQRRMAGILSYHYAFAGFNNNADYLRERFNMVLVSTQSALLPLVLERRADVAVVSQSYLHRYLQAHPDVAPLLLVSDIYDQIYQHHVLAAPERAALAEQIVAWLNDLGPHGLAQP